MSSLDRYTGGSSSPNPRGSGSPGPSNPAQVRHSIEAMVDTKPILVGEDCTGTQDEQPGAFNGQASAPVIMGAEPRQIVEIASDEMDAPSVIDYVGPPIDGLSVNWLDNQICTITVSSGDELNPDKIGVHEKLLLAKSPYFRRVLTASGKAQLGEMVLNSVNVRLLKLLVRWMYGTALGRVFRYNLPDADVTIHD